MHRVQTRLHHAQTHAPSTDHGVVLSPFLSGLQLGLLTLAQRCGGLLDAQFFDRRQELVQRWIQQANSHGESVHRQKNVFEVDLLNATEIGQRSEFVLRIVGKDHLANHGQAIGRQEHVLGAAQANALGAEIARVGGVFTGVGVGTHAELALSHHIGPRQNGVELGRWL